MRVALPAGAFSGPVNELVAGSSAAGFLVTGPWPSARCLSLSLKG